MKTNAAKRLFRLWVSLLLMLVAAGLLFALVHAGLREAASFDSTFMSLDGEPLAPSRWHGGHGLAAFGALLLGAAVLLLVVPLVLLLPLLIVGVLLVVVLAGVLSLLCSPLVLLAAVVWLMWRLVRGPAPPTPRATP